MVKSKSSASSATRKKHSKKATDEEPVAPPQRGQKKGIKKDRFAPKIKVYTPPPATPKGLPDPVDLYLTQGQQIDPELIVILRKLGKRDESTISKGLEGFEIWLKAALEAEKEHIMSAEVATEDDDEEWIREKKRDEIVESMAVWAHHFPRLSLHPSRRLRLQTHALHSLLTSSPSSRQSSPLIARTREILLSNLWLDQTEYVGSWCVSTWDSDRSVRNTAKRCWDSMIVASGSGDADDGAAEQVGIRLAEHAESIASFSKSLILLPTPPPSTDPLEVHSAEEDPAILKTQALLALSYLLKVLPLPISSSLSNDALEFLRTDDVWSLLDINGPAMMRRAGYELLGAIVERTDLDILGVAEPDEVVEDEEEEREEDAETGVDVVTKWVLENCWSEEEGWAGIIAFLRRYPHAWSLSDVPTSTLDSPDQLSIDANESNAHTFVPSPILSRFLTHLATSCSSHPTIYPTTLLLLSTLPATVLPRTFDALTLLFDSFWSPWETQDRSLLIGGQRAIDEFIGASLECLLWETSGCVKRNEKETAELLVSGSITRIWKAYLGTEESSTPVKKGRGLGSEKVAKLIKNWLEKLGEKDQGLFCSAWNRIEEISFSIFTTISLGLSLPSLASSLVIFTAPSAAPLSPASFNLSASARQLAISTVLRASSRLENVQLASEADVTVALFEFIHATRSIVEADDDVLETLNRLISELIVVLAISSINTPISTAAFRLLSQHFSSSSTSAAHRATLWRSIIAHLSKDISVNPTVLLRFIDLMETGSFPRDLESAELDLGVMVIVERLLSDDQNLANEENDFEVVEKLMCCPLPFVSAQFQFDVLGQITGRLNDLTNASLSTSSTISSDSLISPTRILARFVEHRHSSTAAEIVSSEDEIVDAYLTVCAKSVFLLGYLLLLSGARGGVNLPQKVVDDSVRTWNRLLSDSQDGSGLIKVIIERLKELLFDVSGRSSPIDIVNAFSTLLSNSSSLILNEFSLAHLLPSPTQLDDTLASLRLSAPSPALSILDSLIPCSSDDDDFDQLTSTPTLLSDQSQCSSYIRCLLQILEISARDPSWARKNLWILPHLIIANDLARDELSLSTPSRPNRVFGGAIDVELLRRIGLASEGLANYLLSTRTNGLAKGWHTAAVASLRSSITPPDQVAVAEDVDLVTVLRKLYIESKNPEQVYQRRAFVRVLEACFKYGDSESNVSDAERWLALATSLKEGSEQSRMIIFAIKSFLQETPRFERYQNSLASNLAGVSPALASTTGLTLLQSLLDSAPPLDSSIIFLPQQRTIYLLATMSNWISSEVDIINLPDILARLAELLSHLVPIVQDLSGRHWDLVFDVIESNLESASWDDDSTLPALYYSCRLLDQIKDLAATNKELKSISKSRIDRSLELVRDLFVSRSTSTTRHITRSMVLDLMAKIVRDLPVKLLTMATSFDQLIHLLSDVSSSVQQSAHQLLTRIVEQYVIDLIVEVELDSDAIRVIELPESLIRLLSKALKVDALESIDDYSDASTFLFAWLIAFEFFRHASPRIKSAYLDQLRSLDIIASTFLPSIFSLLSVSDRTRSFDASLYSVNEFQLELIDGPSLVTLPVFATFVYYRALQSLPSLIRFWWDRCQNRQLSHAVFTFTSRHFSPVLIAQELAHLRDPNDPAGKTLRDNDDFTVKVAVGANEVKAIYVVDDESMEILIRIPNEFPLAAIEVKEVRKIGVTDGQWKAWMIAVQQVVTFQNGLISDALSLFKRNITSHFAGLESCCVCYSVVSAADRTLPTRACRTCKNLYHPSCLYKWFQTSGGSSCPICRTLF